jgi:hypothetical protein
MAYEKRGPFAGNLERTGKGDDSRPMQVDTETFAENGARTFGEDWLIPPVLRRKREGTHGGGA